MDHYKSIVASQAAKKFVNTVSERANDKTKAESARNTKELHCKCLFLKEN